MSTVLHVGSACSQLPDCRAEKIAAKLPRKDITAVRKRVALLEVRVPPLFTETRTWLKAMGSLAAGLALLGGDELPGRRACRSAVQ